jgi:hypothetical protein
MGLTRTANHNNTISAGFEKDQVVGVLLALRDGRVPMEGGEAVDPLHEDGVVVGCRTESPKRSARISAV